MKKRTIFSTIVIGSTAINYCLGHPFSVTHMLHTGAALALLAVHFFEEKPQ